MTNKVIANHLLTLSILFEDGSVRVFNEHEQYKCESVNFYSRASTQEEAVGLFVQIYLEKNQGNVPV